MVIDIKNIRTGFANNSSSSHSFLFFNNKEKSLLDDVSSVGEDEEYGWSNFTLCSEQEKTRYLASMLYVSIKPYLGSLAASEVVKNLFPEKVELADIDHESVFHFPRTYKTGEINLDFLKEFTAFVLNENIAILGGNDNSDGHPLAAENKMKWNPLANNFDRSNDVIAIKDAQDGSWTLFSRDTGQKIRFKFSDFLSETPPALEFYPTSSCRDDAVFNENIMTQTATPQLVDIKITDFCEKGCAYCYQASTPKGEHASLEDIWEMARSLSEKEVLEVAIGGGEPTKHPDFVDILKTFHYFNIVPNFTTRDLSWIQSDDAQVIASLIGSFAISVNTKKEIIDSLAILKERAPNLLRKVAFQVVVGTVEEKEMREILRWNLEQKYPRARLTLLGFKQTGFGKKWSIRNGDTVQTQTKNLVGLIQEVLSEASEKELRNVMAVGFDTTLAQQCEQDLIKANISSKTYYVEEGLTSMYIDAVKKTMSKSSYDTENAVVWDEKEWGHFYKTFFQKNKGMTL